MCGRYTLTNQQDVVRELEVALDLSADNAWWKPRYNVAPTQPAPVVVLRDGVRTLEMMRWGLVPHWGTQPGAKPPLMINARVESVGRQAGLSRRARAAALPGARRWLPRVGAARRSAK